MRVFACVVMAWTLAACSQSDKDRAREQARQSEEQLKHDSRQAFNKAEEETKKASRALNSDLEKAQKKARQTLDQPDDSRTDKDSR